MHTVENTSSHTQKKSQPTPCAKSSNLRQRSASYLYLKGTIYYFRCRFTSEQKEKYKVGEIRLSLQTGFLHEARKLSLFLHVYPSELLMDETLMIPDIKDRMMNALRKKQSVALAGATGTPLYLLDSSQNAENNKVDP